MGKNERSGMIGETEGGKEVRREGDRRRGIRKKEWVVRHLITQSESSGRF